MGQVFRSLLAFAIMVGGTAVIQAAPKEMAEPTQAINELLAVQWKEQDLTPAKKTNDAEFIRRASLDLIGRIATPGEVRAFEKDTAPDKRARLIDRLLASDEYPTHWAHVWTVWLLNGPTHPVYREQLHGWLKDQLARKVSHKELTEKLLTATGKTTENGAVHFILAHLGNPIPADKHAEDGQFDVVPITWRSVRVFLGYQINCIRCHNHPFDPQFKQRQFWGVNIFFRQVERRGTVTVDNPYPRDATVLELSDNSSFHKDGLLGYEPRGGINSLVKGTFLDGRRLPGGEKVNRREVLAQFMTSHEQFSKAYVNRLWGHFFGRGLNRYREADDFGEHNPVLHPDLLDRLAKDFAAAGHDPKKLMRWICTSDVYQLTSAANAANRSPEAEPYFSRMLPRPLSPARRIESLLVALRAEVAMPMEDRHKLRTEWLTALTLPEVDTEIDFDMCINHTALDPSFKALTLIAPSKEVHAALVHPAGTVALAMKEKQPAKILDQLYLAAYNRHPTAKETAWIEKELAPVKPEDQAAVWQDLFFVLLNSSEFILNH